MAGEVPPLRAVAAHVFRCPIEVPVRTWFGTMHSRPAVLVRAEDEAGTVGWGEVWCNFPEPGAEYRGRLLNSVFSPLLTGRRVQDPAETFAELHSRTSVLALQAGEAGPFAQCLAGIDMALWDLQARRARAPLWRHLGGQRSRIGVYASGLNPDGPARLAAARQAEGHRAFKLKVGFGIERDLANLRALREVLGDDCMLMADANQAWDLHQAQAMIERMADHDLAWLEEPLRADEPWTVWQALAARPHPPLAAGENVSGLAGFEAAIAAGVLGVVQPDMAKWGGFSGCLPVARRILAAGLRFCPHYLGAGIGLLASAHLLAAVGGDGLLEVDANENPLRTWLAGPVNDVVDGGVELGAAPGLGIEPDMARLEAFRVDLR